jgi:hypothetical protein
MEIQGTLQGDVISFVTWGGQISSSELQGNWKVNPDGKSMSGTWRYPHANGIWNLTKIE